MLLCQGDRIADVMAVRTAEIDSRIRSAVWGDEPGAKGTVPQLVIVGEIVDAIFPRKNSVTIWGGGTRPCPAASPSSWVPLTTTETRHTPC